MNSKHNIFRKDGRKEEFGAFQRIKIFINVAFYIYKGIKHYRNTSR
jgi:hypothetical protein